MPVFFSGDGDSSPVGRTIGLSDPHTVGTLRFLDLQPRLAWHTHRSIITRVALNQQCNFQMTHTMGNEIYVYVFGDRVGHLQISGLSMAHDCDGGGQNVRQANHGFELVLDWYRRYRLTSRRSPVQLTIGSATTFQAFVAGVTGDVVDPGSRLMQYDLQLVLLPDTSRGP